MLVDRLDEPHLINGSAELMKAVLWPLLDNKFLKHPGLGLKMMLPMELTRYIEREERPFYERHGSISRTWCSRSPGRAKLSMTSPMRVSKPVRWMVRPPP